MGIISWLHSSKADSNFDEQTVIDDLSEKCQYNSMMNDSGYNTNGFVQDAANHVTNICTI